MLLANTIAEVGIPLVIDLCKSGLMHNPKQFRVDRLRELWRSRFRGNIAAMARALGRSANQIRFYLYPEKPGGRWLGEDFAREIERALDLSPGWLDQNSALPQDCVALTKEEVDILRAFRALPEADRLTQLRQMIALSLLACEPISDERIAATPFNATGKAVRPQQQERGPGPPRKRAAHG